jgi:hypothetical protein
MTDRPRLCTGLLDDRLLSVVEAGLVPPDCPGRPGAVKRH